MLVAEVSGLRSNQQCRYTVCVRLGAAEAGDLRYFCCSDRCVLSSCSERRPIRFRPPSNRIPSAARSDSVRRPPVNVKR